MTQTAETGQCDWRTELAKYHFDLPEELIAKRPLKERAEARLLVYDQERNEVTHSKFSELSHFLPANSQLFFNNSRVIPCRLRGERLTGAQVEVFFLGLEPRADQCYPCLLKSSAKKRLGDQLKLPEDFLVELVERTEGDGSFWVRFCGRSPENLENYLDRVGTIPIPPYIRQGQGDQQDREDYQTVFAGESGSVAAPTAGLHFDQNLLSRLSADGHSLHHLTLHVGLGTFRPLTEENWRTRKLHTERFHLSEQTRRAITSTNHYRVAVGTTALRAMESYWRFGQQSAAEDWLETQLFLAPGDQVESVDALITNFHLPESSLIMLVATLIGREKTLELYRLAVEQNYRFFSYGDGMLIRPKKRKS